MPNLIPLIFCHHDVIGGWGLGTISHDCNELKMVLYNFAREAPATPFSQEELQAASTNIKCSLEDGESLVSKCSYNIALMTTEAFSRNVGKPCFPNSSWYTENFAE